MLLGVALAAAPAQAQAPAPIDLGPALVRLAIEAARTVAEIRYDAIVVDRHLASISVLGLVVETAAGPVRLRELALTGDGLASWLPDSYRGRVAAYGVEIPDAAIGLPEEARALLGLGGPLAADLELESAYDLPSGVMALALGAELPGSGRLELAARLRGLHIDPVSGEPAGRLEELTLAFTDGGLTERVVTGFAAQAGAAPEEVRAQLPLQLQEALAALLVGIDPAQGQRPSPALVALVDELGRAATAFMAEPGTLEVALRPAEPIGLDELRAAVEGGAIERLGVSIAALGRAAAVAPLPAGDGPAALAATARRYLDGVGVPQSFARAAELARAAAAAGDSLGALIEAELLASGHAGAADPASAYAAAARAAVLGNPGAAGLLARLEGRMSPEEIAAAQQAAIEAWEAAGAAPSFAERRAAALAGEIGAMRALARAFATGNGVPRSYRDAYLWASLAAAAGDRPSAGLRDRLVDAAPLSPAALADAQAEAARLWQEMGGAPAQ